MKRLAQLARALAPAILLAFILAPAARAQSAGELFQKAKAQVKAGSYDDAMKTLAALDAETQKPGHEAERKQVEPILALYRGVCEASLGHKEVAKGHFVAYLGTNPNASLDPAVYPKKAVAAFEEARKEVGGGGSSVASIAASYASFVWNPSSAPETPGEDWANGPVRILLTSDEKRDFSRLSDPVSRSEFITKFWTARDSRPETPENEFRQEFERRVAYADANFGQDETRGSLTDRGTVFILLGPPTYVGRKPIGAGDDPSEASGMSTTGAHDVDIALNNATAGGKTSSASQALIADRAAGGPNRTALDSAANWREIWHYRRELLPSGVPYTQVDIDFITRKGYGKNVMQRNSDVINTLEAAKKGKKG